MNVSFEKCLVPPEASLLDALKIIDNSSLQIALVVGTDGRLLGTITDGDARRALLRLVPLDTSIEGIMNRDFVSARPDQPISALRELMQERLVQQLPILDSRGRVVGIKLLRDLLGAEPRENWAVIMAGGQGLRLRPLTDNCPKPMLPVGGQPLLHTIVTGLKHHGITKVFMAVNYMAKTIQDHFGNGSSLGMRIEYLHEQTPLGTAGALSLLPPDIDRPFLVMNGDILSTINYANLLDFHQSHPWLATVAVSEYHMRVPYGVVHLNGEYLNDFVEKPAYVYHILAGIYVLDPEVTALAPSDRYDMTDLIAALMANGQRVPVFPIREYWLDIGKVEDFERANNEFHAMNIHNVCR